MAKSKGNTGAKAKAKSKAKDQPKKNATAKKQTKTVEQTSAPEAKAESRVEKKRGRPSAFSQEIADQICDMLADGWSLRQICRQEGMPDERTVRRWAIDPDHPFSPQYARAREAGLHRMVDEIIEIADDGTNDWVEREGRDGSTYIVVDHEHVTRSRLRIETRKWLLSKLLPQFADRLPAGDKPGDNRPTENQLPPDAPRPAEPDHLVHLGARFSSYRPTEQSTARH